MNGDNELENAFRSEISLFFLKFHCLSTEAKYTHYKKYEGKAPTWFKWLMWSFIVILILRRVELLILTILGVGATAQSVSVEVITVCALFGGLLLEGAAILWHKLVVIRGIPLLMASFFTIAHSSHEFYPDRPAVITIGIPIIVSCSFICNWYLYSWLSGAFACLFGFIMSSFFLYANNFFIYEKLVFIGIYGWAYIAFSLASYIAEYNNRHQFFKNMKALQEKEQWKNLLNQLPLGIVVASNREVTFLNDECRKIFVKPEGPISIDSFAEIKDPIDETSVKDIIMNPTRLSFGSAKNLVYQRPQSDKCFYTIRHTRITFWGKTSTAIILQDQTSFEELKRLDEKYQRLYLASVVHDIRTPLNGILGMLDVIEQFVVQVKLKEYINVARSSAKLLLFLTYDITDLSQIEANMISILKEPFSPQEVVQECSKLLSFNFNRKGIRLIVDIPPNTPKRIINDKNRYMQILLNLLGNALKFTTKGEVKVSIQHLEVNNQLVTVVKDTGIGIKESDMPKLFKLFGKIKENSELNPTGVGLGLTICKKLSERMGGAIKAESVFGLGSTFTFTISCGTDMFALQELPEERYIGELSDSFNDSHNFLLLIHSNPLPKGATTLLNNKEDENEREWSCSCTKLLVVDDNDYNIFILESFCNILGVECDIARNGEEALGKVREKAKKECCKQYKAIFMDINMPVMDGIEATCQIRKWEDEKGLYKQPVIALTAADTEKNVLRDQHKDLGFDCLVGKPIAKNEFKDILHRYHVL